MGFAEDMAAFQAKAKAQMNTSVSNSAAKLFTDIVQRSPSSTGLAGRVAPYADDLLINQWYTGVNEYVTLLGKNTSSTGVDSLARIQDLQKRILPPGKDITLSLTNNLGYAYRVEMLGWPEGDGDESRPWRGAQPYAMVSKAVTAWKAKG